MFLSSDHAVKVMFTSLQNGEETSGVPAAVRCLPAHEQALYFGKVKPLNRLQFLAGRLLARQLYSEICPEETCSFEIGASGKPYFAARPQWGMSITHSGEIVACALNPRGPVGIDAEAIRPVDFPVFEPYFLPHEWEYLQQHTDPPVAFFNLWTRKEAVAKADGRGLGMDFLSIDTLKDIILSGTQSWTCTSIDLQEGYAAALAYTSYLHPSVVQVRKITLSELLLHFSRPNSTFT